jgi:hypothetical protein
MEELCHIKDGLLWIEESDHANSIKELYAIDKFGKKVDVLFVFIRADELHDKGGGDL